MRNARALAAVVGLLWTIGAGAGESGKMTELAVRVDGAPWVEAEPLARAIGAEFKQIDSGAWALCRGDFCVPLGEGEWRTGSGGVEIALDAVAGPLQVEYAIEGTRVQIRRATRIERGMEPGQVPPAFTLPDLFTGEPVSSSAFRGKKTFFYMWASW